MNLWSWCFLFAVTGQVVLATTGQGVMYIGGNTILAMSGSSTRLIQLERDAIGKCNPFPSWKEVNHDVRRYLSDSIYIGGTNFLKMKANAFELFSCRSEQEHQLLNCYVMNNSTLDESFRGQNQSFAYIESEKLIQYNKDSGAFKLRILKKQESCPFSMQCGMQSHILAEGNLNEFCDSSSEVQSTTRQFQVVSLGQNKVMVLCRRNSQFSIVNLVSQEQDIQLTMSRSGELSTSGNLVSLGGQLVLSFHPNLDFDIFDIDPLTKTRKISSGNLNEESPCRHLSRDQCLSDKQCGFCVDTGSCVEAFNGEPCVGACAQWDIAANISTGPAVRTFNIDERQLAHIDDKVFLHYIAATGSYEMYLIVDSHPNQQSKCPSVTEKPIFHGVLPYRNFIVSSFGNQSVLFHNPVSGMYVIWRCQNLPTEAQLGTAAPCASIATGKLKEFIGVENVVTIRTKTFIFNSETGAMSVFNNSRSPDGSEDQYQGGLFNGPIHQASNSHFKGRRVFGIGRGYIFDWNKVDGDYQVWVVSANNAVVGPTARGVLSSMKFPFLAWMGSDRMIAVGVTGEYLMLRFDTTMLDSPTALSFVTIGRSKLGKDLCEYANCQECIEDSQCGWCSTTNQCMPGSSIAPCNDGSGIRCFSWMKNYCSASSCESRQFRSTCISDGLCGWCETSGICIHQQNGLNPACDGKLTVTGDNVGDHHHK